MAGGPNSRFPSSKTLPAGAEGCVPRAHGMGGYPRSFGGHASSGFAKRLFKPLLKTVTFHVPLPCCESASPSVFSDMQRFVGKKLSSPLSRRERTYCSGPVYLPCVCAHVHTVCSLARAQTVYSVCFVHQSLMMNVM
jgi:hypothetical protein